MSIEAIMKRKPTSYISLEVHLIGLIRQSLPTQSISLG